MGNGGLAVAVGALVVGVMATISMAQTQIDSATMSAGIPLRAGPVSVKFADGQLRYLCVNGREIIRRVYFAVREANWDTDMPTFTRATIDRAEDHFLIKLAATCRGPGASFDYMATITGGPDGSIVYLAEGQAPQESKSNRIGICVLFGTPVAAGQEFLLADTDGGPTDGLFPLLVSPTLVAKKFKALQYKTAEGVGVTAAIDESYFEMEDQRNWGDSSFKAYNPMPFVYPLVKAGEKHTQTLRITVENIPPASPPAPLTLSLGEVQEKQKLPAVSLAKPDEKAQSFVELNHKLEQYANAERIAWAWSTDTHLPDQDTAAENLCAIADQAATVHRTAPTAELSVGPISMRPSEQTPRAPGFATAWTAGAIQWLAAGGVESASFKNEGDDLTRGFIKYMNSLAGQAVTEVKLSRPTMGLQAFAIQRGETTRLFVSNLSGQPIRGIVLPGKFRDVTTQPWSGKGKGLVEGKLNLEAYEMAELDSEK